MNVVNLTLKKIQRNMTELEKLNAEIKAINLKRNAKLVRAADKEKVIQLKDRRTQVLQDTYILFSLFGKESSNSSDVNVNPPLNN